jgi:nitroreductase
MNDVIENIITRRSIRVYKPEQVGEEELGLILKTATYAPSGNNCQSWMFTAVQNKAVLEKLNTLVRGAYERLVVDKNTYSSKVSGKKEAKNPGFSFYYNAPALIIASNEKTYPNAFPDCAAAIQNMMRCGAFA